MDRRQVLVLSLDWTFWVDFCLACLICACWPRLVAQLACLEGEGEAVGLGEGETGGSAEKGRPSLADLTCLPTWAVALPSVYLVPRECLGGTWFWSRQHPLAPSLTIISIHLSPVFFLCNVSYPCFPPGVMELCLVQVNWVVWGSFYSAFSLIDGRQNEEFPRQMSVTLPQTPRRDFFPAFLESTIVSGGKRGRGWWPSQLYPFSQWWWHVCALGWFFSVEWLFT